MAQQTGGPVSSKPPPLLVDTALQGGGSHGAFAWGALDRLLDVSWVEVEAISGNSAGAINAAVFAHGMAKSRGGRRTRSP